MIHLRLLYLYLHFTIIKMNRMWVNKYHTWIVWENDSECWLPSSFDMDNLKIHLPKRSHNSSSCPIKLSRAKCRCPPNKRRHDLAWSHWTNPPMGRNTKPATVRGGRVWHGGSPRETRKLNPLTEASWDLRDLKSSYWMNDAEWKKYSCERQKTPLKSWQCVNIN